MDVNTYCLICRSIIWIILLMGSAAMAQSDLDSLLNGFKTSKDDKVKIGFALQLSRIYENIDPIKCKAYADQALQLAEKGDLKKEQMQSHKRLAAYYCLIGNFSAALANDQLALQESSALSDSLNISICYNNIGSDYHDIGDYDEAYFQFTQSYRIAKAIGDSIGMNTALHNVGRVFKEIGQYERALNYLRISLEFSERYNDVEGIPYSLDEIGDVLLRMGRLDSAYNTLLASIKYSRQLNIKILEPKTLLKIANIHSLKKEFETAIRYYDTTLNIYSQINNQFGIAEVELGKGQAFADAGMYDEARQQVEKALNLAQSIHAVTLQIRCYKELSSLQEKDGDFKSSLTTFKRFKDLEDSLFSEEMQAKLLQDQVRFATENKDDQIAALTQQGVHKSDEIKRQEFITNILVVTFALSCIVLISVYRSGQRRKRINELLLEHQEETIKRSEELRRLNEVKDKFFSIISHDLRSPINALAGVLDLLNRGALTSEEFDKNLKELRVRFNYTRSLLNNLLDWTLLQMDKLNVEVTQIKMHDLVVENIQLLQTVNPKALNIINSVPENVCVLGDTNTVNLVLRNLITNALKFTKEGGKVTLGAIEENEYWHVFVKDTGIGIEPDVLSILFDKTAPYSTRGTANEKGTGLGLILSKEFVEKNGGKIWVESIPGSGSTFWFSLIKCKPERK